MIEDIKPIVLGADIQRRRDEYALNDVRRHRLMALGLAPADGPHRNVGNVEFFDHRP